MLLCLTLLLLMGLSACAVAGDEELEISAEAGPWLTLTLEEDILPSILLQLQEVKRGKARQFFGLMGKRVGGIPPIQPGGRTGKCCPDLPLSMLPGEGQVVLATNKSGKWGKTLWPGAHQAGTAEGGASVVWPHIRLPGCFRRAVVYDAEGVVAGISRRWE
ncbi:PREDICTED: tachykinin-4 [Ceratotherium simum simum]|uniref:Tachykinin-4 n=1 Tax=Ceratotherium simum simum TaxID=73337 RepID=A0ABM1D3B5_CERSS|nr:PREDICTED: tachykinin-4 [Ceratotherium simum simum]